MLNLKTWIVIGSDEEGKWNQEGLYMGISILSIILHKFLKSIQQYGKVLVFCKFQGGSMELMSFSVIWSKFDVW